jgi:hypothetical protein
MKYTDTQLKQALAKMLPDRLIWYSNDLAYKPKDWSSSNSLPSDWPLDTELLHLCWLVEETLSDYLQEEYYYALSDECETTVDKPLVQSRTYHATWQQRVIALCKVKGIEI